MNNREVAHLWAAQSRSSARGSSFYFEGPTIYSYGPHFPVARIYSRKVKGALFEKDNPACRLVLSNVNPQEAYQVAEVFNAGPECGQEECQAEAYGNARLIAAAPELYKLLERAFTIMPLGSAERAEWAVIALRQLSDLRTKGDVNG